VQRQETFATVSFLVSQLRYFGGRSAAGRGDPLGAHCSPWIAESGDSIAAIQHRQSTSYADRFLKIANLHTVRQESTKAGCSKQCI